MNKLLIAGVLLWGLLLVGCSPRIIPTPLPQPIQPASTQAGASTKILPSLVVSPTPVVSRQPIIPTPLAATKAPNLPEVYTDLILGGQRIRFYAADMMVVNIGDFTLIGQAPRDTVISVNEDFTLVGADQTFAFSLKLQEGHNLLEINASNPAGQEVSTSLVVIFDPTP